MIIDFHCHLFFMTEDELRTSAHRFVRAALVHGIHTTEAAAFDAIWPLINDPSGDKLVEAMDSAGVDVAVCFPVDNMTRGESDDAVITMNKKCVETAKNHKGRLIPFASIDPRRAKAPEMLRRCVKFGAKGIKLHPDQGYDLSGAQAHKLFEVTQECNLIVLTHTGPVPPPRRNRFTHPLYLDDVGCEFPNLKIVAAHSGGLWHHEWTVVAAFNDHIHGDLAEWSLDAKGRYEKFCRNLRELLDETSPHQLLFATDWPAFEPFISVKDWVDIIKGLPQCSIPGIRFTVDEINGILGNNAQKLLGI